jgi:hypothetical protein
MDKDGAYRVVYGTQLKDITGAWGMDFVSSSPFSLLPPFFSSKYSYRSFLSFIGGGNRRTQRKQYDNMSIDYLSSSHE